MTEKTIKEYLEGMDPERSFYVQKVAYTIKEEALQEARALTKKYFLHGWIAGIITASIIFTIVYYGWLK